MDNGRRPVTTLAAVSRGEMLADPIKLKNDLDRMNPDLGQSAFLGVARVITIDYEEYFVTLRTMTGTEQEFERVPVPLTFPGAGARHFLGSMPEVGDYCVVGWMTQEGTAAKSGGSKTPVILSWIVPGVWPGREWVTTSSFEESEHSTTSEVERELLRGIFEPVRHKLRHIQPGNVVGSSSQGADLVLDESVTLANRRGNEFILRDEDQAVVLRSLQQFHAMAGARVYAGMVQRDALILATQMVGDGTLWDDLNQSVLGVAIPESELPYDPNVSAGTLTPADPLFKAMNRGSLGAAKLQVAGNIDPYTFLQRGGYIDELGVVQGTQYRGDAIYGGKPIYRVATQGTANATLDAGASTLTEYRIELAHTSDGRLPVTEQTDMFDAERLPPTDPDTPGLSPNRAYIEWVMGSVVGNDPYSADGRRQYGVPLVPQILSGDLLNPKITQATLVDQGGQATPIGEHAATLFRLTPFQEDYAPTWWAVNKKGQLKACFGGKTGENSIEASTLGDMYLAVQGALNLDLQGGMHFVTRGRSSLRFDAPDGPVTITGGGVDQQGAESVMERQYGSSGNRASDLPSVDIHALMSGRFRAERSLLLKGQTVEANGTTVQLIAQNEVSISAAKRVKVATEEATYTTTGRCQETFTGPKGLNPTNGALHERSYSPNFPGLVAEKVTYEMGDREESFKLGSHSTEILIGNMTYRTRAGSFTAEAMGSKLEMGATGISQTALVGAISLSAPAGGISMSAMTNVSIMATAGAATVSGSTMVYLGAPITGTELGPILSAGTREPFTGLPFFTWGLGAKSHLIGS